MKLIRPTAKYKKSFLAAVREFQREGTWREEFENFEAYMKKDRQYAKGKDLPNGYVPSTTYWLIDNGKFIGRTSIRHVLTPALRKIGGHIGYGIRPSMRKKGYGTKLLALALKKAKRLGISKVLLTCDDANTASWKIMEANGARMENKITVKGVKRRRYWITNRGR